METMWIFKFQSLRRTSVILGFSNLAVVIIGVVLVLASARECGFVRVFPLAVVSVAALVKIGTMVKMGIAQELTAKAVMRSPSLRDVADGVIRHERRIRYKRWLWWTRIAMLITVLQFFSATYLMLLLAKYVSQHGMPRDCFLGMTSDGSRWKQHLLASFIIVVSFVGLAQCFVGTDVLRWRYFYATQDGAWKSHYQEVFDHGIREALCCLGRVEYMSVLEEDEVYSVARLLGDLVTYRAKGTGHLELLAGLALLQRNSQLPQSHEESMEVPEKHLQGAATFHKFAEAAYTGLLLDVGRNPVTFPCVWIHKQGILTPWTRNRRPVLDGDNWWRGHAAAFLKFVNLSPDALRRGRVCQDRCKAAYFVVILHQLKCVVIAVRGTESPEDLITDGLGRACSLSSEDLDGLMNGNIHRNVKRSIKSSYPHYGHSGIVEAARDLYMQIEGGYGDEVSGSIGFLSSLMGAGCECDGYSIRIVGHSLGGAIAAMLGIRLYGKFPNLHVYAYGPLPCVDSHVADACSEFVTSIIHDNEFSARLSVGSIMRLRASAIMTLSQDVEADSTLIYRLARQFLQTSPCETSGVGVAGLVEGDDEQRRGNAYETDDNEFVNPFHQKVDDIKASDQPVSYSVKTVSNSETLFHDSRAVSNALDNPFAPIVPSFDNPFVYADAVSQSVESSPSPENLFHDMADSIIEAKDPVTQFMERVPSSETRSHGNSHDMYLAGQLIHLLPHDVETDAVPFWKGWRILEKSRGYKAVLANRDGFKDIVVSQSMFLDHLPWRCSNAMKKALESRNAHVLVDVSKMV